MSEPRLDPPMDTTRPPACRHCDDAGCPACDAEKAFDWEPSEEARDAYSAWVAGPHGLLGAAHHNTFMAGFFFARATGEIATRTRGTE